MRRLLSFPMLRRENGQLLAVAGLMMTALAGMIGLVVDFGFLTAQRGQVQNAADAAALAGARMLFEEASTSKAVGSALDYANANGYAVSTNCTNNGDVYVCVRTPPRTGEYASDTNYVEVTVEDKPDSFFIHTLFPNNSKVRARAVAGFEPYPKDYALVVLDQTSCLAFRQEGQASLTVNGGGVMVNSDCTADALVKTGSGSLVADGSIDVNGGASVSGSGAVSPAPETVPWTVEDPLAGLTPPTPGAPPPGRPTSADPPATLSISGSIPGVTLQPGTYYGGINASCTCTITMQPGVYIMAGGGFTKAGGANFVGDGVMIYDTQHTDPAKRVGDGATKAFNLSGSGVLDLSPATSGLYEGITLWQDVAITAPFMMSGSNNLTTGLFYVPGALLDLSGNSELGAVQLVVKQFYLHGSAPLSMDYGAFRVFEAPDVVLVE